MKRAITTAILAAALITAVHAYPTSPGKSPIAPPGSPRSDGSLILNTRLRYEFADQSGLDESSALTLRNRLGFQTRAYAGLSLLAEGEHNWVPDPGGFAPYPPPFNNSRSDLRCRSSRGFRPRCCL